MTQCNQNKLINEFKKKSQLIFFVEVDTLILKVTRGASLVMQWLRIRLPMQGTQVRALVQEDPLCRGAAKPVHHHEE